MQTKKRPYSTPEGYFDALETRLSGIPSNQYSASMWDKFKPYLALVACFAFAYILGVNLIRKPIRPEEGFTAEQFYYSDLIPKTDPYFYETAYDEEQYDESDIVDYLIDSGISIDMIGYYLY